ncbi:Nucleoporin-like protein 2 [Smittium mucronatum]|uniref:Nucleoporin-like protein 2 n=1 Tax=Smittium mucronatum TaxID=133383 RepID=A0A1R0GRE3_9FUNG|nr:Nucleoporin-like protein 2 [Smittium mucronatum]
MGQTRPFCDLIEAWKEFLSEFGDSCRNEHPQSTPTFGNQNFQGSFKTSAFGSANFTNNPPDYKNSPVKSKLITSDDIISDLESFPPWRYTCYGFNDSTPLIISGTDISFEELRLRYYESVQLNNIEYYNEFVRQADAKISEKINEVIQNPKLYANNANQNLSNSNPLSTTVSAFSSANKDSSAAFTSSSSFGASNSFHNGSTSSPFSSKFSKPQSAFASSTSSFLQPSNNPSSTNFSFASAFGSTPAVSNSGVAGGFGGFNKTGFGSSIETSNSLAAPAFGTSSLAFGSSGVETPSFGTSAFSGAANSQNTNSTFGSNAFPALNATTNTTMNSVNSAFSTTSAFGNKSAFGSNSNPASGSAFGTSSAFTSNTPFGLTSVLGASSAFTSNSAFLNNLKKEIFSKNIVNGIYESHSQFGPDVDSIKKCISGDFPTSSVSSENIEAYKNPEFQLHKIPEVPPPYELISPS